MIDWGQLLADNLPAIIAFFSGLVGALAGVSGTLIATRATTKSKEREWRKEYFEDTINKPIIEMIDEILIIGGKIYFYTRGEELAIEIDESMVDDVGYILTRMGQLRARLEAYKTPEFSVYYDRLHADITSILNLISSKDVLMLRSTMDDVANICGDIFNLLQPRM